MVVHVILCRHCQSQNVIRHGRVKNVQRYRCHDCGCTFHIDPGSAAHPEKFKAQILAAYHLIFYQERPSMRGIQRVFGVSRDTLGMWLKKVKTLPPLTQTLVEPEAEDVLELDEMWSFVAQRKNKQWVWLALCCRTRQIVAYCTGRPGGRHRQRGRHAAAALSFRICSPISRR